MQSSCFVVAVPVACEARAAFGCLRAAPQTHQIRGHSVCLRSNARSCADARVHPLRLVMCFQALQQGSAIASRAAGRAVAVLQRCRRFGKAKPVRAMLCTAWGFVSQSITLEGVERRCAPRLVFHLHVATAAAHCFIVRACAAARSAVRLWRFIHCVLLNLSALERTCGDQSLQTAWWHAVLALRGALFWVLGAAEASAMYTEFGAA